MVVRYSLLLLIALSVFFGCSNSPVINEFKANSNSITSGDSVVLSWNVSGASAVDINGTQVSSSGNKSVSPTSTTAYNLTASNGSNPVSKAVVITVLQPPPEIQSPPASTPTPTPTPAPASTSIKWDDAKNHIGEYATVCGNVTTVTWVTTSKGQPTFINIGKAYPNPNRFTVLIWVENRKSCEKILSSVYNGKNICVTGLIKLYSGVPEIEVSSQAQIELK